MALNTDIAALFRQLEGDPEPEVQRAVVLTLLNLQLESIQKSRLARLLLIPSNHSFGLHRAERLQAAARLGDAEVDEELASIAANRADPDRWAAIEGLSRQRRLPTPQILLDELSSDERGTLAAELLCIQPFTREALDLAKLRPTFETALNGHAAEKALWLALLLGRFEDFQPLDQLVPVARELSSRQLDLDRRLQALAPASEALLFYLQARAVDLIRHVGSTGAEPTDDALWNVFLASLYSTLTKPAREASFINSVLARSPFSPMLMPLVVHRRPNPRFAAPARDALTRLLEKMSGATGEPTQRATDSDPGPFEAIIEFAIVGHVPLKEQADALIDAYKRGPLDSRLTEALGDTLQSLHDALSPLGRLLAVFPNATPDPQQVFNAYQDLAKEHAGFAARAAALLLARVEPSQLLAALAPWLHHPSRPTRLVAWRIVAAALAVRKNGWARRAPLPATFGAGGGGLEPLQVVPGELLAELGRQTFTPEVAATRSIDERPPGYDLRGPVTSFVVPSFNLGVPKLPTPEASTAPPVPEPDTFVNFEFRNQDEGGTRVDTGDGLLTRTTYELHVSLSHTPDARFSDASVENEPPIVYPSTDESSIEIDVVVISAAKVLAVENPLSVLRWIRGRPSEHSAVIRVRCGEPINYPAQGRLDVYISYRGNILYVVNMTLDISPEPEWSNPKPIRWRHVEKSGLTRLYRMPAYIRQMREKKLSVVVERDGTDLLITAFSREVAYPTRIQRTQQEIARLADHARFVLDTVRTSPIYANGGYNTNHEYIGEYGPGGVVLGQSGEEVVDRLAVGKAIHDVSSRVWQIGNQIWKKLFLTGTDETFAARMAQYLNDGSTILIWISIGAEECALPWALVCEDAYDPNTNASLDFRRLWGYRFAIEQRLASAGSLDPTVATQDGVRMLLAMHNFEPWTATQEQFFEAWKEKSAGRFSCVRFNSSQDWRAEFFGSRDILYFYAHGRAGHLLDANYLALLAKLEDPSDLELAKEALDFTRRQLALDQAVLEPEIVLGELRIPLSDLKSSPIAALPPIVILNMCESAPTSAYESDSWVSRFFALGVRTVVGTEAPILPAFGDAVARRLFDHLLSHVGEATMPSICEALHFVRREFLERKNLLILAYVSYGDARFVTAHN